MIRLKDILTKEELKKTMLVLEQTKYKYGHKDYVTFKKMVLVVGFIYGLEGYISYHSFINRALDLMKSNQSPIHTFGFQSRRYNESFFGIEKKIILNSSVDEIRVMMANLRIKVLKWTTL